MKALGSNSLIEPDVLCKGFLKDDILPTQKHDVLMDCIITEERVISKNMQKYNMYLKEK